jgi:hypothetical protein
MKKGTSGGDEKQPRTSSSDSQPELDVSLNQEQPLVSCNHSTPEMTPAYACVFETYCILEM